MIDLDSGKKRKGRAKNLQIVDERKYECVSCERKYLSYSALYTHNKIKHGITISTKGIDSRPEPKPDKPAPKSKYKNSDNEISHNKVPPTVEPGKGPTKEAYPAYDKMNIEDVTLEFFDSEKRANQAVDSSYYCVMDQLFSCLNSHSKLIEIIDCPTKYTTSKSAAFVPLIFNYFVTEYLPSVGNKLDTGRVIHILFRFWRWLSDNKVTQFEVGLS